MDPAALTQFTQLNRDVRETKKKLEEAEKKLGDFAKIEKARQLAKDGKHFDAIREAGFDVDAALAELLQQNGGQASPDLIALKKEIDELKGKQSSQEKEKAERAEADAAAAVKNDRTIAGKFVTENVAKYAHLAKASELVDAAFKDFTDARTKLEKEAGASLPGDEQAKLLIDALAVHEEKWAKVFGAPSGEVPVVGADASLRAGPPTPAAKQPDRMTFDQVKAARRAAGKR
jgi:hypothetical protein